MPADSAAPRGGGGEAERRASPTPRSTYRLQLHPGFGFDDAAAVAPYLADLGVSHLYASPYLQAAPGSTHGYDVVDHGRTNAELGGDDGHARLCAALGGAGLGQVLDVVPNHMAISGRDNAWWWDVLENGPSSVYASYFDVDWDPPEAKLRNTVLLPILADHYGRVLEAGELEVEREGGSFVVRYHEHAAPVAPRSLDSLLHSAAERCAGAAELESIATALGRLPPSTATDRDSVLERHRDKEVLRARLARLCEESPDVAEAVDAAVAAVNADPDDLDALLERQNYRLAFWRTAGRELDYRRFFDITTLVGLRVEDPQVFDDTHRLVLSWVRAGVIDGLRIDHPDGLRDPEAYLHRLSHESGGAWVVVEKILERGEALPATWPVAGTTGYDYLNLLGGLFLDGEGLAATVDTYRAFTGHDESFPAVAWQAKHETLRQSLAADLTRLTGLFVGVCERNRRYRDHTRHDLHEVLREVIACFPVYRTYVRPTVGVVSEADVAAVDEAVEAAIARRPEIDADLFGFLRDLLLLRVRGTEPPGLPRVLSGEEAELVARFQQVTGAVMAKGVEDTAFYRYLPFVALNEVGGDPGHGGAGVDGYHEACLRAQREWPHAMTATSTHDTKRSEDVRARLAVLSEVPRAWHDAVERWAAANARHRQDDALPDRAMEYLLYQTLVGAWPLSTKRAVAYMEKASREAKVHTSWVDPDPAYDEALRRFVEVVLADAAFVADLEAFVDAVVTSGRVNSVAQALLKLVSPGVPDTYQGTELWDLSLVDPDNRRPVDFVLRRRLLASLDDMKPEDVCERAGEGLTKLLVTSRALNLRRRRPELFGAGPAGSYEPLVATGAHAERVVACVRGAKACAVVPRLVHGLHDGWGDTTLVLPPGAWHNLLTGDAVADGEVLVDTLLARFPVALLEAP